MLRRIEIGTDIATIGVWDPTRERHDLKTAKYAEYESGLRSEAEAGRLFMVYTGADGGFLTDIYVDEQPDPDCLSLYSAVEREFLIECQSGRLIAGGVEDFIKGDKQITSDEDQFTLTPGRYALRFYELIEDRLIDRLKNHVGPEDYAYYESKFAGFPWGCLLLVIATISLFSKLWLVSASVFALWAASLFVRSRVRAADHRFQDTTKRIEEFEMRFPPFIYVLRRVTDADAVEGGWHELS